MDERVAFPRAFSSTVGGALEITTMRPKKPKNSAASTFLHDTFDRLFWS
jgi:hypothetical protein